MRILELNAYYDYGSTGRIVRDLCQEGTRRGHDMYAVYWLLQKPEADSDHVRFCGEPSTPCAVMKIFQWVFLGGGLRYYHARTLHIVQTIREVAPDLIHIHNLHGDFSFGYLDFPLLMEEIAALGVPVIWTFHDCWPFTGRCTYYQYKHCDRFSKACGHCPQRFYDREGILWDQSAKNLLRKKEAFDSISDLTVVTVSEWLAGEVRKSILKNRRVVTVYNGIDTDLFQPGEKAREVHTPLRVLAIGWDRRKGYVDYFSLAEVLGKDAVIQVLGNRPFFRRQHPLPSNLVVIPRTDKPEEMAEIYRNSDIYYNASAAETFGLTTVEAMACGTPVVGYRSTATPEVVDSTGA